MKRGAGQLSKEEFERLLPSVRDQLLAAQSDLQKRKPFALAVIVTGIPTAGRSEVVNHFLEWLDPKHIKVHALEKLRRSSRTRPPLWRYWITLPARGEIAIYFLGWYEDYLRLAEREPQKARRREARVFARIRQLEAMLVKDQVRVLKLHLQVAEKTAAQRLKQLRSNKLTRWRITHEDRWSLKHFDCVQQATRRSTHATADKACPWHLIDGTDPQLRALMAGTILLDDLREGLDGTGTRRPLHRWPETRSGKRLRFKSHQPGPDLDEETYKLELEQLQGRFALLVRRDAFAKRAAVFAFEGMDAAGKGGAIRRLTGALDARQYNVVPVSAPTPEELAHPYLWRFWRNVPDRGELAIFDRTWYGRVLVERVRDLTPQPDWRRAYDEIREFELQLAEHRIVVHKFWLVVGKDEQLKRFKERDSDALKRYKVDAEDWANRRFYDAYQAAAQEMIERTHTGYAPWTVVEADDKKYARLKVLKTACEALEQALGE